MAGYWDHLWVDLRAGATVAYSDELRVWLMDGL